MGTVQPQPDDPAAPAVPLKVSSTDDPAVLAEQHTHDYSNHVVPLTARAGKWQLAMSYWSLLSAMVWIFYGALVASLYGTEDAIVALVVATVLYSAWNFFFARWSIRSGLNSTLLSRRMFGVIGSALTALLIAANVTYYAVFESSALAVAFQHYTPHMSINWWYLIVVVAMLPLMLGGVQSWMARLNSLLLPFYLIGIVACVITAIVRFHPSSAWLHFGGAVPPAARPAPGWLLGVIVYFGLFLLMTTTTDFARFGRKRDERFHGTVTFGAIFYIWLYLVDGIVGIFLVEAIIPDNPSETGVVQAIIKTMGVAGLIFIVVSQTRINSLNYYESSANWDRFVSGISPLRIPRLVWVGIISAVVFLLMLTDVFSWLNKAVAWQGDFFAGWVGIVTTHMILTRGRAESAEFRAGRLPRFTPGLVVWIISAALGIWLTESSAAPATLKALSALVVLVVSAVLYAAVALLLPVRPDARPDVRAEVGDVWGTYVECAHCHKSYVAAEADRDQRTGAPTCDKCATNDRVLRRSAESAAERAHAGADSRA